MAAVVADASIIAKLFLDEEDSGAVEKWLGELLHAGEPPVVPTLLSYEVGNLIVLHLSIPAAEKAKLHAMLVGALNEVVLDGDHLALAFRVAAEERLTFYDAAYIALAAQVGGGLATADGKIAVACRKRGIAVVVPGSGGRKR